MSLPLLVYYLYPACEPIYLTVRGVPGIGKLEVLVAVSSRGDVEEPVGASPRLKKKTFGLFFSPLG